MSGDGLPHEALNGLRKRPDFDEIAHIPIGPLPGGSGNALCSTLAFVSKESESFESSVYLIIKNQTKKMDLLELELL